MELGSWELTEEFTRDYLAAVGDNLPIYAQHGLVPPVALAARALGNLLEQLELPPGAIHSLQEISALNPVSVGQVVSGSASVGQPKRRGSLEFITTAVCLRDEQGKEILNSKSTVLVADAQSPESPSSDSTETVNQGNSTGNGAVQAKLAKASPAGDSNSLPVVSRTITQEQLDAYAQISGDNNPLHLDAQFAATTQFGGIIAHGMLTLAFVSEMMASKFQLPWLESGALRVRFKGAAYIGDSVETIGHIDKEESQPHGKRLTCSVGVTNTDGQQLISGSASVLN